MTGGRSFSGRNLATSRRIAERAREILEGWSLGGEWSDRSVLELRDICDPDVVFTAAAADLGERRQGEALDRLLKHATESYDDLFSSYLAKLSAERPLHLDWEYEDYCQICGWLAVSPRPFDAWRVRGDPDIPHRLYLAWIGALGDCAREPSPEHDDAEREARDALCDFVEERPFLIGTRVDPRGKG